MQSTIRFAVILIAVVSLINAAWIFGSVPHWFEWIPGVADTGNPNGHFVRDVGLIYGLFGAALLWVLRDPPARHPVFILVALFYLGHALGHVGEIFAGALPPSHWLIDIPLVFLPGLLLGALALPAVWGSIFEAGPIVSHSTPISHR